MADRKIIKQIRINWILNEVGPEKSSSNTSQLILKVRVQISNLAVVTTSTI